MERALDTSREDGKIAIYNESMDSAFKEHVKLELSLKNAINSGMHGFDVHYQPLVDAKTGLWKGVEALCRWNSPEFGNVRPDIFIHEAEQLGLISTIGNWVLERAVSQCKAWGLDAVDGFLLDVNFSPIQMTDEDLESTVFGILEKYGWPGGQLCMEITESRELNFSNHMRNVISSLREKEIILALDDFGIGYSSFQNLKNIPVSVLKTERQFVIDIENDRYLQNLFRTMVDLAHVADMQLVAEGVETEAQRELLVENGADILQGYYFSRPIPAAEMEKLIANFREKRKKAR